MTMLKLGAALAPVLPAKIKEVGPSKAIAGPEEPLYDTPDAAAIAAGNRFNRRSTQINAEAVGGIVKTPEGKYRIVGGMRPRRGTGGQKVAIRWRDGEELVGYWHTHGAAGAGRHVFSPADTKLADERGRPIYLADPNGDVKVYRPGTTPKLPRREAAKLKLGFVRGTSLGEAVVDPQTGQPARVVSYEDPELREKDLARQDNEFNFRYRRKGGPRSDIVLRDEAPYKRPVTEVPADPDFVGPPGPGARFVRR